MKYKIIYFLSYYIGEAACLGRVWLSYLSQLENSKEIEIKQARER